MLVQVVGSVLSLIETYADVWPRVQGSKPTPILGFPFEVGLEPVPINVGRMSATFRQAVRDLLPVYAQVMPAALLRDLQACAALSDERFALPDELWVTLICSFALAYHRRALDREHLVKSLTPLYLGWVASFACQTANEDAAQVEERIERLCLVYEQVKPTLITQWPLRTSEKR
jgi:hypothetical protein